MTATGFAILTVRIDKLDDTNVLREEREELLRGIGI